MMITMMKSGDFDDCTWFIAGVDVVYVFEI